MTLSKTTAPRWKLRFYNVQGAKTREIETSIHEENFACGTFSDHVSFDHQKHLQTNQSYKKTHSI